MSQRALLFTRDDTVRLLKLLNECLLFGSVGYYEDERELIKRLLERVEETNVFQADDIEGLKLLKALHEEIAWREEHKWDDNLDVDSFKKMFDEMRAEREMQLKDK